MPSTRQFDMLSAEQIAQLVVRMHAHDLAADALSRPQARMIANAESSGNVSSRDGVLMKRLPEGSRFGHRGLVQYLQARQHARARLVHACSCCIGVQDALLGNESLVRSSMSTHFSAAIAAAQGARGRHALYALRSMALVQAGKPALALKVRAHFCA